MFSVVANEVRARGFSLSIAHLVFEDIVRAAGVSRAAAFRLWPTRDDFNIDVLTHVIERLILQVADEQVEAAAAAMIAAQSPASFGDWDRAVVTLADLVDVLDSRLIKTRVYLLSIAGRLWVMSGTEEDSPIRAKLTDVITRDDREQVERFAAIADTVMTSTGFQMRPSVSGGTKTFIRLMINTLEGTTARHAVADPERQMPIAGLFVGGQIRDHGLSMAAAAVVAIAAAMMEPIPTRD